MSAGLVLLIEDDVDIRETLSYVLEDEGFSILKAENGVQAFKILEKEDYKLDLIIVDLMMPEMNGYQFLEKIKLSSYSQVPIIVLSASRNVTLPDSVTFLQKPFYLTNLLSLIENLGLFNNKIQS